MEMTPLHMRGRRRRRRRRCSQNAHGLSQEEIPYYDDSESKSISREPTSEEEEEAEEEEDEDEEVEDEREDVNEEELAPESSMEEEKKDFALHLENWESSFSHGRFGFDILTSLSPMVFTHCTPSCIPHEAILCSTLQMCSIRVAKIRHLEWPLHVYGLVAARDYVDHKRNVLFYRPRIRSQTLTKKNPYLHLTGPSRAIMSNEPVHIEFQLRVKGGQSRSEDRRLVTRVFEYNNPSNRDWYYSHLSNYLCKIDLCFEQLTRSRQATVLSVCVARGSPFRYGGQVLCSASPYEDDDPNKKIVLFDSKHETTASMDSDGTMTMDPDGYLDLWRRVVSVQGRLKFYINTYSRSGAILASGRVSFRPKDCQTSWATCFLHNRKDSKGKTSSKGEDEVKITVAWSRFAEKLYHIERDCFDL